jgi:hypothetical protein
MMTHQLAKYIAIDGIVMYLLSAVRGLSFKHEIKIKIKLTVSNIYFFFAIHSAFVCVFVCSNSSIVVTIQN